MIRIGLILTALLASTMARAGTVMDQYQDAARTFLADAFDASDYQLGYFKAIRGGLQGRWMSLSILFPGKEPPDDWQKKLGLACEKNGSDLKIESDYQFSMTRKSKAGELRHVYTAIAGNMFGEYVEPKQYLAFLGIDDDRLNQMQYSPLNSVNGIATVNRPSTDIMVIQSNYRVPQIYGRCP